MTFEEIVKDLKAGKYKPLYFLNGEEPFFIDQITELVEKYALAEDEKAFNQTVMYGNEVNMTTITDTARRFPVLAQRQVIIVREAQNIKDFDNLLPYIDHLQLSTVLLFAYKNKKADKRKNVFKNCRLRPIASGWTPINYMKIKFRTGSSTIAGQPVTLSYLKLPGFWQKAWGLI